MPEIRKNLLTGEWVIIAPERAKRGGNTGTTPVTTAPPDFVPTCPFCPGNEDMSEERYRIGGEGGGWQIRSVVNKFSVLSPPGTPSTTNSLAPHQVVMNAVGRHEVLVESPHHSGFLALGDSAHIRRVLDTYHARFLAFYADPHVRHVVIFKNHGAEAGASQAHPHSQIVGLPIIPGQVADRIERAEKFYREKSQCLGCALIETERSQSTRIIAENEDYISFIPFAALSPYHLWIFPKRHSSCFAEASISDALAGILHTVLSKLYALLHGPAFNLVVRSLAPQESHCPYFHWYISIVPRITRTAGFELGTGMYVNPSSPEENAAILRNFVVPSSPSP